MQQHTIAGTITLPKNERQQQLQRQLSGFFGWMQRTKDANEILKDKRKSIPLPLLPMVF